MRLLYITFFLLLATTFSSYASTQKESKFEAKKTQSGFASYNSFFKIATNFQKDIQSFQKDFITRVNIKYSGILIFSLISLAFTFFSHKELKIPIAIVNSSYYYLSKILYPKHFFR